ncbi:hypothetical protein BH23GEM8_BH23GEM8_17290 [soil metagenome]
MNQRLCFASLMIGFLAVLPACSGTPAAEGSDVTEAPVASPAPGEPTLEELRALSKRFRDVNVALSEGFIRDPMDMCVSAEMEGRPAEEGAMGIHFIRPDLLGIAGPPDPRVNGTGTHSDFRNPAILIYEPQADGSLELVALENLVFAAAWRQAGNQQPPSFHGLAYDHMQDDPSTAVDEAHGFEEHYDRHVWLYRENPRGVFVPMNPNVSCRHHSGNMIH